ncbi:MAG: hypothetical protein KF727_01680 [Microbacteriaceae bacterium]|nr:hypothetical protein [Microbacteriaceae bacterium]
MTIEDDGEATPDTVVPGAGIRSMRERAEELRGHLTAGPTATGWRVEATIPLV